MSCLTNKSLFYMIISVVCTPTFSADSPGPSENERLEARRAVCKANVHLVFPENRTEFEAFKYASFILSIQVIIEMTNTVEFANFLRQHAERLRNEYPYVPDFHKFIDYADQIGNRNVEITNSEKANISGYFRYLLTNLELIEERIEINIKSPAEYCRTEYSNGETECRRALKILLRQRDDNFNGMTGYRALRFCYLKYSFSDFFDYSIFSPTNSRSSTNTPAINNAQRRLQRYQRRIMNDYFRHLMGEVNLMSFRILQRSNVPLFPTVEQYCRTV